MNQSTAPRVGDWMLTATGRKYWPIDPQSNEVELEDISTALSKICRFGGQVPGDKFYSVAEHSYIVSMMVPEDIALAALMHDASEAYLGDWIRPIKNILLSLLGLDWERVVEENDAAIALRFGIPALSLEDQHTIKRADDQILHSERELLLAPSQPWKVPDDGRCVHIYGMSPQAARRVFESRFHYLTEGKFR